MTRIIAGAYASTQLQVPRSGTRPTTDRVREAVVGSLEARGILDEAIVLDLFAGSGALGLEALSRGGCRGVFVDSDRAAVNCIAANIRAVNATATAHHANVRAFLDSPHPDHGYDVVFCDPPYEVDNSEIELILSRLLTHQWLTSDAVIVLERSKRSPAPTLPAGLELLFTRRYGDTVIYGIEYTLSTL